MQAKISRIYAGIGSRRLDDHQLALCRKIGRYMARHHWTLQTGACTGADQAFAEGAVSVGGKVRLYLPWGTYEKSWVDKIEDSVDVVVLDRHPRYRVAVASVLRHHPNPTALSRGGLALHARNYLIVAKCRLVVAFPLGQGGTTQGIRIAETQKIPVVNLDDKTDDAVHSALKKVVTRV